MIQTHDKSQRQVSSWLLPSSAAPYLSAASPETVLKHSCFLLQAYKACSGIHKSFIIAAFGEPVHFQISKRGQATQKTSSSFPFHLPVNFQVIMKQKSLPSFTPSHEILMHFSPLLINTAKERLRSV